MAVKPATMPFKPLSIEKLPKLQLSRFKDNKIEIKKLIDHYSKHPISISTKSTRIDYARNSAVRKAAKQELLLMKLGSSKGQLSKILTSKQKKSFLVTGKLPPNMFPGHHLKSVSKHPSFAGRTNNIEFVKGYKAHLARHFNNFHNPTSEKFTNRSVILKNEIKKIKQQLTDAESSASA